MQEHLKLYITSFCTESRQKPGAPVIILLTDLLRLRSRGLTFFLETVHATPRNRGTLHAEWYERLGAHLPGSFPLRGDAWDGVIILPVNIQHAGSSLPARGYHLLIIHIELRMLARCDMSQA
jgi:hypothetical protein